MRKKDILLLSFFFFLLTGIGAAGQTPSVEQFPVRGIHLSAPSPDQISEFNTFIRQELMPRKINTLLIGIDYAYQFERYPELRDQGALSKADVKSIVETCKEAGIRIIPEINLLGHQSWESHTGKLLSVYPEFDETPWVIMPDKYEWPNKDNLYCKSYCPLYPGLHEILFDVIDELCEAFETDAFHAGMDEVFYIAEDRCPRCGGKDPAELFAGEVTKIRNHLAGQGRELWIWGDRLIDGKTTGMGMWEASMNNTARAIDLIPKDVTICDWHYERPDQTAVYFALKGFDVVTCPWRKLDVAEKQVADMQRFKEHSAAGMKDHFLGIVETTWMSSSQFIEDFDTEIEEKQSPILVTKRIFPKEGE